MGGFILKLLYSLVRLIQMLHAEGCDKMAVSDTLGMSINLSVS